MEMLLKLPLGVKETTRQTSNIMSQQVVKEVKLHIKAT